MAKQLTTFPIGTSTAGKPLTVDVPRLLDTRMLVQASSGAGKSWLLRLLAEHVGGSVQTIVLDPEGEFSTLREKLDLVLVGRRGELAADLRSAELLARRLMELRVSAVVDLVELKLPERRRFVRLFLESLMGLGQNLWHPLFVLLDEAHMFCPERSGGEAESTEAVIDLCSRGRKRGFAAVLATQRLSKLHKDAAAELANVAIGRTTLDVDVKRAIDVLGLGPHDKGTLRGLEAGEFLAFGPAANATGVERFRAGAVQTTHPRAGERHKLTPPEPSASMQRVIGELADLPKQADEEAKDLAGLRRELADAKRKLADTNRSAPAPSAEQLDAVRQQARAEAEKAFSRERRAWDGAFDTLQDRLSKVAKLASLNGVEKPIQSAPKSESGIKSQPRAQVPVARTPARVSAPTGDLESRPQRFLDAAATLQVLGVECSRETVAAWLGVHPRTGSFGETLKEIESAGLIVMSSGRITVTDAGMAQATTLDPDEAIERAKGGLGNREARFFDFIVAAYPEEISREAIAENFGLHPRTGSFGESLKRLVDRGLVECHRGHYRARDFLFAGRA